MEELDSYVLAELYKCTTRVYAVNLLYSSCIVLLEYVSLSGKLVYHLI